jgi:hypothetical protein
MFTRSFILATLAASAAAFAPGAFSSSGALQLRRGAGAKKVTGNVFSSGVVLSKANIDSSN